MATFYQYQVVIARVCSSWAAKCFQGVYGCVYLLISTKKPIAINKKAYFNYKILDALEAGIVLNGPEIKAVRAHRVNISGSYIRPLVSQSGQVELWWLGGNFNLEGDKTRSKKLLLHRDEIEKLSGKVSAKGYALLPLELYLKRGVAKLKIGLGVSRKKHDKRDLKKAQDLDREAQRELKGK